MRPDNLFIYVIVAAIILVAASFAIWYPRDDNNAANKTLQSSASETSTQAATTTAPAESEVTTRATSAYTQTRVRENGGYVTIVTYDGTSFNPQIISINRGESVRFVNKSSRAMRIASNTYQNIPIFPGFNQVKSVGRNGTYALSFVDPGVWGYHNMDQDPTVVGVVYVK